MLLRHYFRLSQVATCGDTAPCCNGPTLGYAVAMGRAYRVRRPYLNHLRYLGIVSTVGV